MLLTALIFGDGMVLQQKKPIFIWGTCEPEACVTLSLDKETVTVYADLDGKWRAKLSPHDVAENLSLKIQSGTDMLVYSDIAVGEVYLAGGQSNMEFQLAFDKNYEKELASCDESGKIRLFDYPEICYAEQMNDFSYVNEGFWRKNTKSDIGRFTAVGYYFAKHLSKVIDVPIGIISCNWGGTPACAWMNPDYLEGTDGEVWLKDYKEQIKDINIEAFLQEFKKNPINDRTNLLEQPMNVASMKYVMTEEAQQEILKEIEDAAKASSVPAISYERRPGGLYEHMLMQIAPYSIRGVIWYQGETDGDYYPNVYDTVFTKLIENWRTLWKENLPFLFVQIAPLRKCLMCDGNNYIEVRNCQERVSHTVSDVWMTTSGDVGLEWDIHPKDKEPIGRRLSLLARGHIYQEDILCDPPEAVEFHCEKERITIRFAHGDGLWIDGEQINSLYAELLDGKFETVKDVTLHGNEIVFSIPKDTKALCFAQEAFYQVNLYNEATIPAKPFRYELYA